MDAGRIGVVMHLMRLSAPVDVAETLDWLGEAGWRARAAWGGPPDWPGNASLAVEFAKDGDRVSIARDRGQWMFDMYPDGWGRSVDLEIVHAAITGRSDWSSPRVEAQPVQLPSGVSWREWVPRALSWLSEVPDREQMLRAMQLQRSRDLFPVTRSRRKRRSRTRPQQGVESPGPGPGR